MSNEKKYYISNYITRCFPFKTEKVIQSYGVLKKYIGKLYTRDEIDDIICELIKRHPFVSGAMSLKICIMYYCENVSGYYQILNFTNDNYKNQRVRGKTILFEKNEEDY